MTADVKAVLEQGASSKTELDRRWAAYEHGEAGEPAGGRDRGDHHRVARPTTARSSISDAAETHIRAWAKPNRVKT